MLFAAAFYRSVTLGLSLGEALLRARQEVIRQKGWQGLTWASYMLYGDPTFTLLPTVNKPVQPVLGKSGKAAEAERCFHIALEIARSQPAKWWELQAAMSLSRLWQQQGKQEEARQMLAEIYSWSTEGFDTADLQEAKALLEQLA